MSTRSGAAFRVELRPSRVHFGWLASIHGLAFLACLFNQFPAWFRAGLALVVLGSSVWSLRRARLPPSLSEIEWREGDGWRLGTRQGERLRAQLLGSSRISSWFALLHFTVVGRRLDVLIWPDSLNAEAFRLLRVHFTVHGTS